MFGGDDESFIARDAETGAELWRFETAGAIVAAPVAYEIGGREYIVAGRSLVALALPESAGGKGRTKVQSQCERLRRAQCETSDQSGFSEDPFLG